MTSAEHEQQEVERRAFAERARARQQWPGQKVRLEDLAEDPRIEPPEAAVALVWQLSVECWRLGGREIPDYQRANAPGRVWRLGAVPPEHAR